MGLHCVTDCIIRLCFEGVIWWNLKAGCTCAYLPAWADKLRISKNISVLHFCCWNDKFIINLVCNCSVKSWVAYPGGLKPRMKNMKIPSSRSDSMWHCCILSLDICAWLFHSDLFQLWISRWYKVFWSQTWTCLGCQQLDERSELASFTGGRQWRSSSLQFFVHGRASVPCTLLLHYDKELLHCM